MNNTLNIIDQALATQGRIDDYSNWTIHLKHSQRSFMTCSVDDERVNVTKLAKGNIIYNRDLLDYPAIITEEPISFGLGGDNKSITAYDVFWVFKGRLANATDTDIEYTAKSREYIIKDLLANNVTVSGDRNVTYLSIAADQDRGGDIDLTIPSGADLEDTIITILAGSDELGLYATKGASSIAIDVYEGSDRSQGNTDGNSSVVFSIDFNNLIKGEELSSNTFNTNVAYVGGVSSGSRIIEEVGTTTGNGRRETWVDGGDASSTDELEALGQSAIMTTETGGTYEVDAIDGVFKYGTDFFLGDLVTVVNKSGVSTDLRVMEVELVNQSHTKDKINVTFGQPNKRDTDQIANNSQRIGRLETKLGTGTAPTPTAPVVSSFSPANSATNVAVGTNLVITFDQTVTGDTGSVDLYNDSDTLIQSWVANTLTISGAEVTINPTSNLGYNDGYYVQIDADAFKNSSLQYYAGIANKTTWAWDTEIEPAITTYSPTDGATNVDATTDISFTFNQAMTGGVGYVDLYNASDTLIQSWLGSSLTPTGNTFTVTPTSNLGYNTGHYTNIDNDAFKNVNDTYFDGISDSTTWNFTTELEMLISTLSPADGATSVSIDSDLVITFNQNASSGTGEVHLYETTGDVLVESFDSTDWSIVGAVVTIPKTADFDYDEDYYVKVDDDAFKNINDQYFAGIADETTWNFTSQSESYTENMIQYFVIPSISTQIRHKIEMPTDADGVMIRWKSTAWATGDDETDGTLVATITDDTSYKDDNEWYEQTSVTNGTRYYFKAFPYKGTVYNAVIGNNESSCKGGGLKTEYTFDSITGSTLEDTANSNDGTNYNVTTSSGGIGNYGVYNGPTAYTLCDSCLSATDLDSSFSITCLLYIDSTAVLGYPFFLLDTRYIDCVYFPTGTYIRFRLYNGADYTVSTSAISTNTWLSMTFTRDKSTGLNIYIDNVSEDTSTYTGNAQGSAFSNTMGAGYSTAITGQLKCRMDSVRYWTRALETYELTNIENGGDYC